MCVVIEGAVVMAALFSLLRILGIDDRSCWRSCVYNNVFVRTERLSMPGGGLPSWGFEDDFYQLIPDIGWCTFGNVYIFKFTFFSNGEINGDSTEFF